MVERRRGAVVYALLSRESFEKQAEKCIYIYIERERGGGGEKEG